MRQKGFTLVEILVVTAVGSVILMGVLLSISQVLVGTDRSKSQVIALTDIAHAARSIKKDLIMTQTTDLTDGNPIPQSSATLAWVDYTSFGSENTTSSHSSSYSLSGTQLQRTYDGVESIVGRNITSVGFTQNGKVIDVVITATGPGAARREETLKFSVYIRAEEVE
ncbi:type II secretion system protein J [Chloroflexota bacterium]